MRYDVDWIEQQCRAMSPERRIEVYRDCLPKGGFLQTTIARAALPILEKLIREDGNMPKKLDEEDCC